MYTYNVAYTFIKMYVYSVICDPQMLGQNHPAAYTVQGGPFGSGV